MMNICVAHPASSRYSETFIRAHISALPAQVYELLGGDLSFLDGSTEVPVSSELSQRLDRLLVRKGVWPRAVLRDKALGRFLRARRIGVVLAEYGPTGEALWSACSRAKVPLVVHFHGFDAYRNEVLIDQDYRRRYTPMFASAAALVAVSKEMERQLLSLGAPPEKVHVIPCGVDLGQFSRTNSLQHRPRFLSTGRFVEKKPHYLTILAFQRVLEHVPDARLVVVGEGPHLEVCQNIVKGLGLEKYVDLPGAVSHERVRAELEGACGFVLHSVRSAQNDSEGTPVSVLEASAMGLPVISTRHAGIVDAVEDGETGFLVDERDVAGMTQAMLRLARDPDLCRRMGQAGRLKMAAEYGMEGQIAKLWDVLHSAARAAPGASRSSRVGRA